ncbi:DMT family transporter [Micromonospora siamensis]|uniref:Permease of the drug/metabolite transporter (DMT) superfamily n=1 Tax=Micromonospora siamensis TaxID=299152 RepID=A0A1C5GLR3_9ACTN|nr:DMT family transporter [Micromonospora siamensis]SCG34736.1 Permease of the drug/metabolite transporter (DMT) superfamily [Micromonospora siamensis]
MRSRPAAIFPLIAVLGWGATFPVLASALSRVDALNLSVARYAPATAVFVVLLLLREGRAGLRADGRLGEVVTLGIVGFAGFNVLANLALGYAAPQQVALFVATSPLLTQLVRWARDGVRPRPALLALSLVALVGVGLVITRGRLDGLGQFGVGGLMMLLGVIGWAVYTHGAGRFAQWSPLRYTTLTALTGTAAMLAVSVAADLVGWQHAPAAADLVAVAPQLAYAVLAGSVIAVLAWNTGVRRLGAANAALFMNLVPVVTFAVQIARGYRPGVVELAGAGLTIAALVAANLVTRTRPAVVPVATRSHAAPAGTAVTDRTAVTDPVAVVAR